MSNLKYPNRFKDNCFGLLFAALILAMGLISAQPAEANIKKCIEAVAQTQSEASVKESLPQLTERVTDTSIDFIDASSLKTPKGKFVYSKGIDPSKDVLLMIDKNGHFSLSSHQVEFNGRVINKPIDLATLPLEQHDKIAIIRLNNLTLEEQFEIRDGMKALEGKRSLSCLNAIEFLLDQTIGLRTTAAKIEVNIHPSIAEFIGKPWVRRDDSLVDTTVYKFTPKSFTRVIERIFAMERMLQLGAPLTLPGWIGIALDPTSLVKYQPKYKFIRLCFDFRQ